jgi:cell division protein FtsI/penicillin-binding protein 2
LRTRRYRFRIGVVLLIFTIIIILIIARIVYIHVFFHEKAIRLAERQHTVRIELQPKRGSILDRNLRRLAVNLKVDSVYAVAKDIKDKRIVAKQLARIFPDDEAFFFNRLNRDKLFVWIARKISDEESRKVRDLNISGIHLIDETKRFYPNATLACQTIGFAGMDNIGLEGIEAFYDSYMAGKAGYKIIVRDAKGREIHAFNNTYVPPVDGYDIITTIDEVIQHIAEEALEKVIDKHKPKSASAIVMDPFNGDILAIAVLPGFDLNEFNIAEQGEKRNRAITDYYEPGSVFKVITASACIDSGRVSFSDEFFCEQGAWNIARRTLRDTHEHGNLSFEQIIVKSSNIGTVKAAMELGENQLYKYIRSFGFGRLTNIGLPGEIKGVLRPLNRWTKGSIAAIPMGHEIGVTLMQISAGISAIANGGILVKPRIVSRIIDVNGEEIKRFNPVKVRRVISEDTSRQVRFVMKSVIEDGTGRLARLKSFDAGGKTGTAQKIDPSGRYSRRDYVASFVGFAPVEKPAIAIAVMIDTPRNGYYGGVVAAPVFKDICNAVLRYLGVQQGDDHAA